MEFEELPKEKVEVIHSILDGSPKDIPQYDWLKSYPFNPIELIDNQDYLLKIVAAGITTSGALTLGVASSIYSIDVVRQDKDKFDTDRHLLQPSGDTILKQKGIHKDFPEHHASEIPDYYKKDG